MNKQKYILRRIGITCFVVLSFFLSYQNVYAGTKVVIFNTANSNSWTVPLGVTSLTVKVWGGGGGGGNSAGATGAGGGGAFAKSTISVTPGEILTIVPGGGGKRGSWGTGVPGGAGGISTIGAGGAGGASGSFGTSSSGGGGGAGSFVLRGSTILVAAGGGGAGGASEGGGGGGAGGGGGVNGSNGGCSSVGGITGGSANSNGTMGGSPGAADASSGGGGGGGYLGGTGGTYPTCDVQGGGGGGGGSSYGTTILNGSGITTGNSSDPDRGTAGNGGAASTTGNTGLIYLTYFIDSTPPTPNPMTFSTNPYNSSIGSVSMIATTATDASSPPTKYYFTSAIGSCGLNYGTGGTSSGWQLGTTYTDTGLQLNKCYAYTVTARDKGHVATTPSGSFMTYSTAAVPSAPTLSAPSKSAAVLRNNGNGNSSNNPTTLFTEQLLNTSPNDPSWENKYVDASGNPSAVPVWLSDFQLDGLVVRGLVGGTYYNVRSKARNNDGDMTVWSALGNTTTMNINTLYVKLLGNVRLRGVRLR